VLNFVVWMATGLVYCLYINYTSNELAFSSISSREPLTNYDAHERLGHPNKDTTTVTS